MINQPPPYLPAEQNPALPPAQPGRIKKRYVFLAGAIYGLLMRLAFGLPFFLSGEKSTTASEAMLTSFIVLVPLIIGALTVYFPGDNKRSLFFSVFAPWIPILMFILGTAILLIEGSICIAMAAPLFLVMGSLGVMNSLLLLPLLLGSWERNQTMPVMIEKSDASVWINAKPEVIWHLINNAEAIQPTEMQQGLAYKMGVPYPKSALTVKTDTGRVRKLRWDKGVRFDEPITHWQENRYIRWNYSFPAGAIPPDALDEHVVIGGKYFDLEDTSYLLTPEKGGTRLSIKVTYRVSTQFNWYANFWGRLLVDDAAHTILAFYKHRAEIVSSP
ncbi:MAG: SRPBCC family protein [Arenimonas sp.]